MDLGVFVWVFTLSFILSLFSSYDRVIGIAGILLGFVTIAVAGFDGTINTAYGFSGSTPLSQGYPVYPEFIVIGFVIIVIEVIIVMKITAEMKRSQFHPAS